MMWYEKYADRAGVNVNPDPAVVQLTLQGLEHNKEAHGARYCPCRLDRVKDTICPCRPMRENQVCECGLFVKINF